MEMIKESWINNKNPGLNKCFSNKLLQKLKREETLKYKLKDKFIAKKSTYFCESDSSYSSLSIIVFESMSSRNTEAV